jgi:hypothetical protein
VTLSIAPRGADHTFVSSDKGRNAFVDPKELKMKRKMQRVGLILAPLLLGQMMTCLGTEEPTTGGLFVDHFVEEALWVAAALKMDIGGDAGPLRGWLGRGTRAQQENKSVIVGIVKYCAAQANAQIGDIPRDIKNFPSQATAARKSYDAATLAAWRICETNEAGAYKRMILESSFKDVDPRIIKECSIIPEGDSYVAVELCVQVEAQIRK